MPSGGTIPETESEKTTVKKYLITFDSWAVPDYICNADSPEQALEKAIATHPEEARMVLRVYLLTCCLDRS